MKAGTFKEALANRVNWALLGGGPALSAFACWLVWILWQGGWPQDTAAQRIHILGTALFGIIGILGVVIALIGLAGPLRALKAGVGPASVQIDGDEA